MISKKYVTAPDSDTRSLKEILRLPASLPPYQRDFAWDTDKMNQLWGDLIHHLFRNIQDKGTKKKNKQNRYFLGAIVRDKNDINNYIVDGQQRFTTLLLISCALRDSLISTRHYKIAEQLQKNIIVHIDEDTIENRFTLLDLPPNDALSSETRIRAYRKPLANIDTGLLTKEIQVDQREMHVDCRDGLNWTLPKGANWKFRLWDENNNAWYNDEIYSVSGEDNDDLYFSYGNRLPSLTLSEEIDGWIPSGLKIMMIPDIIYPGREGLKLLQTKEKDNLTDIKKSDIFDDENREFYTRVRTVCEHFIEGYKQFTPSGGVSTKDSSTSLKIVPSAEGSMSLSARELEKDEIIEFQEAHSSVGWPTLEEIKQIMANGAEEKFIEFKASWKHRALGSLHEGNPNPPSARKVKPGKTSDLMIEQCAIAIASFMNTAGGLLLVGVNDSGEVVGINRDFVKDGEFDMESPRKFNEKLRTYFGNHIQFVDFKPYKVDEVNWIMACKVKKANVQKEISATKKWCKFEGRRLQDKEKMIPTRQTQQNYKLKDEEKQEFADIADYLIDVFGEKFEEENVIRKNVIHKYKSKRSRVSIKDRRGKTPLLTVIAKIEDGKPIKDKTIPEHAVCRINYLTRKKEWPSHLRDRKDRAQQLAWLVQNVSFSSIEFNNNPDAAIDHFMLTNDPDRISPLNAYDLVSSMTQKITAPIREDGALNKHQKEIRNYWDAMSQELYISTGKNADEINNYFYSFLLSTQRTLTASKKYGKSKTWAGINEEFNKHTNLEGEYDYPKLAEFYNELKRYTQHYIRAVNHNSEIWGVAPYSDANCRDERTYLYALKEGGASQLVPFYMALCEKVESDDVPRGVIRTFLKNFNYFWLRIFMLKKLVGAPDLVRPNQIETKQTGSSSWIDKIKQADLTNPEDVERVGKLPLELIDEIQDKATLEAKIPWEEDHEVWKNVNFEGDRNSKQIKHVLISAERALESSKNPQMPQLHGPGTKMHVEHILPLDAKNWEPKWYADDKNTVAHGDAKYHLGNHCLLEDSLNSSIKNAALATKIRSYEKSKFMLTRQVTDLIKKSGSWSETEMSRNSVSIMNSLIKFYSE